MKACGLCRRRQESVPRAALVPDVVSDLYSDWDRWDATGGACEWCIWAHRHRPLRSRAHLVHPDAMTAVALVPSQIAALLTGEWPPAGLLVIPISRKKHVAPFAAPGMVCVDDANLPWTFRDAALVPVVAGLRSLGAGEGWLSEHEPPWPLIRRHGLAIRDDWMRLDGWRRHAPSKLTVAILATRKDKQPIEETDDDE